jgi:hypothetical protein
MTTRESKQQLTRLIELEKQDQYLFHGSGLRLAKLEPRQAFTTVDDKSVPDGEPGVHASQMLDYAIFMAVINRENCPAGLRSSCSYEDGKLVFGATAETLEQISDDSSGYVHVFSRSDFIQRNHTEWVSHKPVEPIEVLEVTRRDFKPEVLTIEPNRSYPFNLKQVDLKRFEHPDEVREFDKGRFEIVHIGGMSIGRATYQPGWRWSEHVAPLAGTPMCTVEHLGLVISGHATAAMSDGTIHDLTEGTLFYIPAEPHDSWVVGDEPYVSLHFIGTTAYASK